MLGGSLLRQKKYAEAEPLILSGYEGMKAREARIPPRSKDYLTQAEKRVEELYDAWGRPEKAAEWRANLHPRTNEALPPNRARSLVRPGESRGRQPGVADRGH
jgi:hypothetical protein